MITDSSIIQTQKRKDGSSTYPVTKQTVVLDVSGSQPLTTYINSYNVSVHQINRSNSIRHDTSIFTLNEAIDHVPSEYRYGGLILSFNSSESDDSSLYYKTEHYRLTNRIWSKKLSNWSKIGGNSGKFNSGNDCDKEGWYDAIVLGRPEGSESDEKYFLYTSSFGGQVCFSKRNSGKAYHRLDKNHSWVPLTHDDYSIENPLAALYKSCTLINTYGNNEIVYYTPDGYTYDSLTNLTEYYAGNNNETRKFHISIQLQNLQPNDIIRVRCVYRRGFSADGVNTYPYDSDAYMFVSKSIDSKDHSIANNESNWIKIKSMGGQNFPFTDGEKGWQDLAFMRDRLFDENYEYSWHYIRVTAPQVGENNYLHIYGDFDKPGSWFVFDKAEVYRYEDISLYPTDPILTRDANNCTQTGFYGFVDVNTPENSGWGNLSVIKADNPDGNGYISIEQLFYGRSNNNTGSVWTRLMFEKDGSVNALPWSNKIGGDIYPSDPQDYIDANLLIETGIKGYVSVNIPSDFDGTYGTVSVRKATVDGNGNTPIEQIFYGRDGNDIGKIWMRLGFIASDQTISFLNWERNGECNIIAFNFDISKLNGNVGSHEYTDEFEIFQAIKYYCKNTKYDKLGIIALKFRTGSTQSGLTTDLIPLFIHYYNDTAEISFQWCGYLYNISLNDVIYWWKSELYPDNNSRILYHGTYYYLINDENNNNLQPILKNRFSQRSLGNTQDDNIDTCHATGFYGWVEVNRPSDSSQWGSCSVMCSDDEDANHFISIEQTFYGRGNDTGKIWKRLNFYRTTDGIIELSPWSRIS